MKDQIAHVAGVESMLEGHRDPEVEVPDYDHLGNELSHLIERAVEVAPQPAQPGRRLRAGAPPRPAAVQPAQLRRLSADSIIPGPFGPAEAATVAMMRTFDIWVHEQDIRSAIGRPGNLDSPAAAVFVQQALARLPRVVARDAKVDPGHTVILALTGPIMAKVGVRVDEGEDGRPLGHEMFTGESVDASTPHVEGPITSFSLSTDAFTRRAAGRRSVDDTTYTLHSGDEAVARRVLDAPGHHALTRARGRAPPASSRRWPPPSRLLRGNHGRRALRWPLSVG